MKKSSEIIFLKTFDLNSYDVLLRKTLVWAFPWSAVISFIVMYNTLIWHKKYSKSSSLKYAMTSTEKIAIATDTTRNYIEALSKRQDYLFIYIYDTVLWHSRSVVCGVELNNNVALGNGRMQNKSKWI